MNKKKGYAQFCPVARGAEIFAERWTPLVLRELLMGSHRFNELRKGLPKISQSVLSQRLKELEWAGILERKRPDSGQGWEYHLTQSGEELRPVVVQLGVWAYRWYQLEITEDDLDVGLLMIDMRRGIDRDLLPDHRVVVHFYFPDAGQGLRRWWLVFDAGEVDLCQHDPGFPVDISLETSLLTMTRIWMGDLDLQTAIKKKDAQIEGPRRMIKQLPVWIGKSLFGQEERQTNASR